MKQDQLPELYLWPLSHYRPYHISHLKLNGQRIPVKTLFMPQAPKPEFKRSKTRKPTKWEYYSTAPQYHYTPVCPYCEAKLDSQQALYPKGTCASTAQESKFWARWHGHLLSHPECAAKAFPKPEADS